LLHPGRDLGLILWGGEELAEELLAGVVVKSLLIACPRFQVVLVAFLGQRNGLAVPGLPGLG
jgi:hypothetical protein